MSGPHVEKPQHVNGVLEIAPHVAAQFHLPPISLRLSTAGTPMSVMAFPEPGWYLRASGPPGGLLLLDALPTTHHAVDYAMHAVFTQKPHTQPMAAYERIWMWIGGVAREGLAVITGQGYSQAAWLGALVPAASTTVLVMAAVGARNQRPEAQAIASHDCLAPLLTSLAIA
jgi:hypothetical protein